MEKIIEIISQSVEIVETNFNVFQGEVLTLNLTFKKSDGTAQDITGYKLLSKAKRSKDLADDAEGVLTPTCLITDANKGLAIVKFTKTDFSSVTGVYFYDVKYLDTDSNAYIGVMGKIVVLQPTTKGTPT
jgi:hypothetical protein